MTIHLVTDRRRLSTRPAVDDVGHCLVRQARFAVEAGVDVVQLREADLDARHLVGIATDILRETRGTSTRLIINERFDVALAAGADGVHLPSRGLLLSDAVRRLAPQGLLIGRSVHSVADLASSQGADYLLAGTVWATASKPDSHALLGLGGLQAIVRAARVPVLAIGGMSEARVADVASARAAGMAAIGFFLGEPDSSGCRAMPLVRLVESLRQRFDTSKSGS